MTLLFGLLGRNKPSQPDLDDLISAAQDLSNVFPHKDLDGKSPQEVTTENPDRTPDIISSMIEFNSHQWIKHNEKSLRAMKKGEYLRALQELTTTFRILRQQHTTDPNIFRLFANAAVCYFLLGDEERGKAALEMALVLNINYTFARTLMTRYRDGALHVKPKRHSQHAKIELENFWFPMKEYFDYLQNLHITFATTGQTADALHTRLQV